MKGHGGLALLGDYSDEEEAGADLDAYVASKDHSKKRSLDASHQELVHNSDDSDSSSDERDDQEPELPQAALFLDYGSEGGEEEDDDERRILTSPEAEENEVDDVSASFPQKSPSPESFPDYPPKEPEVAAVPPSRKVKRDDLDEMFNMLPPAKKSCPKDLRDKVKKYMLLKDQGQSINGKISTMKSLRNPYILEDLLMRHGLDELGSNFSKDRFNPHGFEPSDFHESLQATQHSMMSGPSKKGIVEITNGSKIESSTLSGSTSEVGNGRRLRKESRKNSNTRWDVGVAGVGIQPNSSSGSNSQQQQVIFQTRSSQPLLSSSSSSRN
jgi:hypothetical protein